MEYPKDNNYLFLDPSEYDLPIYRILPFESILEMINTNQLTLVKTKKWEDPYENFLLKCNAFNLKGEGVNLKNLQEQIFGQCWTLINESDAYWRIYSHNLNGVRIQSTINKLLDVIFNIHKHSSIATSFIGKVQYSPMQKIEEHYSVSKNIGNNAQGLLYSHLMKRIEFEHEKEIRLLYRVDSFSEDKKEDVKYFDINPNDLIENIMLDPRISERDESIYRETLKKLGYRNPIIKSNLYAFNPLNITIPF